MVSTFLVELCETSQYETMQLLAQDSPGINVQGSHFVVTNNSLKDVGGGGTPGFVVELTDSRITDNTFSYTGRGPVDAQIVEQPASQRNLFKNNRGFTMTGNVR